MGLSDLPDASGQRHVKAFERLGWTRGPKKRGKGDHIIMVKQGRSPLSIPDHRTVKRTVLRRLIQRAGLTEEEYLDAFR